jgi:hypothetical protein
MKNAPNNSPKVGLGEAKGASARGPERWLFPSSEIGAFIGHSTQGGLFAVREIIAAAYSVPQRRRSH